HRRRGGRDAPRRRERLARGAVRQPRPRQGLSRRHHPHRGRPHALHAARAPHHAALGAVVKDALVARLADRAAIQDLLTTYFLAIDRRDWDGVRACFTETAQLDYVAFRGDTAHAVSCIERGLARFEATMHFGGNVLIALDGDRATSDCYAVCYHR